MGKQNWFFSHCKNINVETKSLPRLPLPHDTIRYFTQYKFVLYVRRFLELDLTIVYRYMASFVHFIPLLILHSYYSSNWVETRDVGNQMGHRPQYSRTQIYRAKLLPRFTGILEDPGKSGSDIYLNANYIMCYGGAMMGA